MLDLKELRRRELHSWSLDRDLKASKLVGGFFLLAFEDRNEVDRVLKLGKRSFQGRNFFLECWGFEARCSKKLLRERWVRVVGLLLHMWKTEVFQKIGDCCGGFIRIDEDTLRCRELQWARMLVSAGAWETHGSLQLVVSRSCLAIQLWWEGPPLLM